MSRMLSARTLYLGTCMDPCWEDFFPNIRSEWDYRNIRSLRNWISRDCIYTVHGNFGYIIYIHTIYIYISLIIYYIYILCKYIHIIHTSYHHIIACGIFGYIYIYNIPGDFSFRIAWKNPCNLGKPRHNLSPKNPPFPRVTFLPAELPPRFGSLGSRISPQWFFSIKSHKGKTPF